MPFAPAGTPLPSMAPPFLPFAAGAAPVLERLFPSNPALPLVSDTGPFQAGVIFQVTTSGNWFEGYWWYVPPLGDTAAQKFALWSVTSGGTGVVITAATVTSGILTAGAWNYVPLSAPVQLAIGSPYIAATGWDMAAGFPALNNQFGAGQPFSGGIMQGYLQGFSDTSGTLVAPYGVGQGLFSTNATFDPSINMPNGVSNSANFGMDVQVSNTGPAGYSGSYRVWPNKWDATPETGADVAQPYVVSTEVRVSRTCTIDRIWYFSPASAASLATWAGVYSITGADAGMLITAVTSPSWSGAAGSGWVNVSVPGGVMLSPGAYKVAVFNSAGGSGGWSAKDANSGYFTSGVGSAGVAWGPLFAPPTASGSIAYTYDSAGSGNTPPFSGLGTQPGQPTFAIGGPQYPYLYAPVSSPVPNSSQVYWVDLEVT